MKIGIAQINTTVGDLSGNRAKIIEAYGALCEQGADVVLFPELTICGYSPRDLFFKERFVEDCESALKDVVAQIDQVPAVIGCVRRCSSGRSLYNSAAWCIGGEILQYADKCLLPSYDIFEEKRYFTPAARPTVVEWAGLRIGLTLCEDIWTGEFVSEKRHLLVDPVEELATEKLDCVFNLSASPWYFGKHALRESLVVSTSRRTQAPVVYCNLVGGNDEPVFDGRSLVTNAKGELIASFEPFKEVLDVMDLEGRAIASPVVEEVAEIHKALVLGLSDYAHKCGFRKVLLGLSGGIDSAVVATLAVEAMGAENVLGVGLPSEISSEHSKRDAEQLAKNLGIEFHLIPIHEIVRATERALAPLFEGLSKDITEENIQARSRALVIMGLSNKLGALVLSTGNKNELSVGYCTLYGDMAGGLAVISDLPKTKVYALAEFMNREVERIPQNTITKPPSAELRPDQKDQDSLPDYPILDAILSLYIEEYKSSEEIVAAGFDPAVVSDILRKVDLNEYKRKQAAPGIKITPRAFGLGRRIPIVQKYLS